MTAADAQQLVLMGIFIIAAGLITTIAVFAALIRCGKNYRLTKTERGLWIAAQLILMFPSFIYLIVVDKSPWWKAAGVISLIISCGMIIYAVQSPTLSNLPDMSALTGMQQGF